jgi:hypothetical protein
MSALCFALPLGPSPTYPTAVDPRSYTCLNDAVPPVEQGTGSAGSLKSWAGSFIFPIRWQDIPPSVC